MQDNEKFVAWKFVHSKCPVLFILHMHIIKFPLTGSYSITLNTSSENDIPSLKAIEVRSSLDKTRTQAPGLIHLPPRSPLCSSPHVRPPSLSPLSRLSQDLEEFMSESSKKFVTARLQDSLMKVR